MKKQKKEASYKNQDKQRKLSVWRIEKIEIYGGVIMYMAIGLCLGVVFGTALDNLPLGIAIGVAVGAGIDSSRSSKQR